MLDATRALYVREWPYYPQYYIALADVDRGLLIPQGHPWQTGRGVAEPHGLRAGGIHRAHGTGLLTGSLLEGFTGTVRFGWASLDAWFEEDEQVFAHPRGPHVRSTRCFGWASLDAWFEEDEQVFAHPRGPHVRSTRCARTARCVSSSAGVVLADSPSPVMVFETGLPTRHYLSRTDIDFGHLIPTYTVTACPSKGITSGYRPIRAGGTVHTDLAWSYEFPARRLAPIAGLGAFYIEKVEIFLAGQQLEQPKTHFFPADGSREVHIAREAAGGAEHR
jgi:uncharacterized protein (DUF427 family)